MDAAERSLLARASQRHPALVDKCTQAATYLFKDYYTSKLIIDTAPILQGLYESFVDKPCQCRKRGLGEHDGCRFTSVLCDAKAITNITVIVNK